MFRWLRNRKRQKLTSEPFPVRWQKFLSQNIWQYSRLSDKERISLHKAVQILIAEKKWEGCAGLSITEEIKVTISGLAALPILNNDHDYYSRVDSILVYPTVFSSPNQEDGWEDDELSDQLKEGMAVYRGPVLVSWNVVKREAPDETCGHSVVIHEFVHQIDFQDYDINGAPPIKDRDLAKRWQKVMIEEFAKHRHKLRHRPGEIYFSQQAGDSETEFFADTAEAFFCDPVAMSEQYPDIYDIFSCYFQLDPKSWAKTNAQV